MGMAASQARFLGLTARKSNVEYQGQQINQQRTALSNESANLYNQMMELTVPTPPSTSDFYKTSYVLEGSQSSYANSNYKIDSMAKTYVTEGQYTVTLVHDVEYPAAKTVNYNIGTITTTGNTYNIPIMESGVKVAGISYDSNNVNPKKDGSLAVEKNRIYEADASISGYAECCPDTTPATKYYFYQDKNGNNNFITEQQLKDVVAGEYGDTKLPVQRMYEYTKQETTQVIASLEKSTTNGRYTSIQIADNEDYPAEIRGAEFSLTTVNEMDQNAYDDAYNDYEYNKTMYEKSIADINAQTEIIQNEDQQLELRLQQLNTEQNAISTEMDSVSKVIEDNVEKTFKVFA